MRTGRILLVTLATTLAAVAVLTAVVLAPAAANAGENLIVNPGFEEPAGDGTQPPSSWTALTSSPYRGVYPDAHSGPFSAYLHGGSGSYSQTVPVGASAYYMFEVYTRVNASTNETVTLDIRDSAGFVLDTYSWSSSDHGWSRHIKYLETPVHAWDAVVTLAISGDSAGEAWFDDVALEERVTDISCFIATAAYGSGLNDHVEALREFRDSHMAGNPVGSGLVSAYYDISPPIAEFIDDHPALKPLVRAALFPAVAVSESALASDWAKAVLAGAATLLFVSGALLVRKAYRRV